MMMTEEMIKEYSEVPEGYDESYAYIHYLTELQWQREREERRERNLTQMREIMGMNHGAMT